ncbi:von Willebrand factor A domain-containing protein 8 [Chelonus insularis]|uniref:von Willebrand factor A domain-containing protein 8 n=1 Tax=Chelonus insularis TaxID=460826 RepID=UPI00158AB813|nr:von Willebrand factor A domain-containing protein 8 [Chelonus insularis]XP_034940682.1 von Willebrand factor A domain-containing protein 8 [Chelonus insularis]
MILKLAGISNISTVSKIIRNSKINDLYHLTPVRFKSDDLTVRINDVSKKIRPAEHREYIPRKYFPIEQSQELLRHLRWMLQKDVLGQDMFLIGGPGSRRRNLAMAFLELTEREVEFIALSRDTTETDLKQRREIVNGSAIYHDQSAVRAAKHGRVLILEGIEKAERNVLPILNNLLENREMHLEDGRFLMSAVRYDKLLETHTQEELDSWKLVRVNEDFRVIALGLPSPRYLGQPLDPPLRSRFQARHITPPSFQEQMDTLKKLAPNADEEKLSQLLSCCHALISKEAIDIGLPDFPLDNLITAAPILDKIPKLPVFDVFYRFYPYKLFLGKEGREAVESILDAFEVSHKKKSLHNSEDKILGIEGEADSCLVSLKKSDQNVKLTVSGNPENRRPNDSSFIETKYQNNLFTDMILSHLSSDYCIIGPKGCGKSTVVEILANNLGYEIEPIVLYQDMTSRDLIQQRSTMPNGDTIWKDSPLIISALTGKLAVLDGIHRVHPSTLAVLYRLIHDREIQVHDGKRLMGAERFDEIKLKDNKTDKQLNDAGIFKINPAFKIIALAEPPVINSPSNQWLTSELLSLFHFHEMRPLHKSEEIHILKSKYGEPSPPLLKIIDLAHTLRSSNDPTLQALAGSLSTRQLLRIASRMHKFPNDDAYNAVHRACLARFLPAVPKQALEDCMKQLGIRPKKNQSMDSIKCIISDDTVTIGKTTMNRYKSGALTKVPDVLFYDIRQHLILLESLLQDFILGQNILLVGNQGVGKNKIVDRLLFLLNRPREYIQLHRDTTVQTLTLQPIVRDGVVVYEDSPLVQAVKLGHVLLIDEADKAPTHVTCILKTLAESGQMTLSDGRRIISPSKHENHDKDPNTIVIHQDFRMIVLANRPGFPFLGNDFFGALGDLFSTHSVDNPSMEDEIMLLKQYAPDVNETIIQKLVQAFGELRNMSDQGLLSYPYSTREVVNIVKHLQRFPNESLITVVNNVFDFDRHSPEVFDTLIKVFTKYDIPIGTVAVNKNGNREYLQVTKERYSGLDVSGPKHGKVDPKNEPHVGGNTWAGGTGGRDTAGLGGKGGPYRLDAGHTVHQLSDEEKNAVPEHVKKAAREMGIRAFKERLKEIRMSEYDHKLYSQFSDAVSKQVKSLRVILGSLQAKSNERQWLRHQTSGELDDTKLIESLTGEKTIYRRRAEKEPEIGTPLLKPKRLKLVVDVSGSMYRFNGYDGRLYRELEACVMVMEAFCGYEGKFKYDIVGHSGDEYNILFVDCNQPPTDNKQRLEVIKTMYAHAQYCLSGDHTLEATEHAITSLAKEEADESIVVVLSDANLERYGIPPEKFGKLLTSCPEVNAYAIFIGSLGDQADRVMKKMPSGRAFVCMDLQNIPRILQQIFAASVLSTRSS